MLYGGALLTGTASPGRLEACFGGSSDANHRQDDSLPTFASIETIYNDFTAAKNASKP